MKKYYTIDHVIYEHHDPDAEQAYMIVWTETYDSGAKASFAMIVDTIENVRVYEARFSEVDPNKYHYVGTYLRYLVCNTDKESFLINADGVFSSTVKVTTEWLPLGPWDRERLGLAEKVGC